MIGVIIVLKLALFMLVLVLYPRTEGIIVPVVPVTPFAPRPLCNFQLALANQACAYLPFVQVPPQAPRSPLAPPPPYSDEEGRGRRRKRDRGRDGDGDDDDDDDDGGDHDDHDHDDHDHDHDHDDDDENDHDHDHDDDHDDDDDDDEHKHGHGHRRHRHHHRHRDTPVEQQCCKWLSQVDDQCVCELLVRLPPFLARPVHLYSVVVGRSCNVTYSCGSRLRN